MENRNYTFAFTDGSKNDYILPNDVTGRELIEQFISEGKVGDMSTSSRPGGYVFKSDGRNDIILPKDGGDQTIEALGFVPGVVYQVRPDGMWDA